MQLKIKRSQAMKGLISKSAHFQLGFRVQYTPEEKALVEKYKLGNEVIATIKLKDDDPGWDLTPTGAEQGRTVECKSLGALLHAEAEVKKGCEHLRNYLEVAETFDGRELVHDFA